MESAFGVEHGEISKGNSALHVPVSLIHMAVPRTRNSAKLLKLSEKIDNRIARKKP